MAAHRQRLVLEMSRLPVALVALSVMMGMVVVAVPADQMESAPLDQVQLPVSSQVVVVVVLAAVLRVPYQRPQQVD